MFKMLDTHCQPLKRHIFKKLRGRKMWSHKSGYVTIRKQNRKSSISNVTLFRLFLKWNMPSVIPERNFICPHFREHVLYKCSMIKATRLSACYYTDLQFVQIVYPWPKSYAFFKRKTSLKNTVSILDLPNRRNVATALSHSIVAPSRKGQTNGS